MTFDKLLGRLTNASDIGQFSKSVLLCKESHKFELKISSKLAEMVQLSSIEKENMAGIALQEKMIKKNKEWGGGDLVQTEKYFAKKNQR